MVQYNLPEQEKRRRQPEGPQVASVVSELSEGAPKLLLYLAKKMMGGGGDPRSVYKQTGWYQDVDGQWLYSFGDQKLKVREDNPLLNVSKSGPTYGVDPMAANQPGPDIQHFEKPGLPMKHDPLTDAPEGYYTQSKGIRTVEDDPVGEEISYLVQQQKRYPERPWDAQQPPGAPAYIENRMKLYPDMYPVDDQLSFQDTVPSGPENFDQWDQWAQPKTDYSKVRINERRGPTAEELFSHDTLFDLTPEMRDVRMGGSHYTHGGPQDYRGSYVDMGPGIIEATGSLGGVKLPNSMESVALHEFGHKGQRVYQMPRGGNPDEGGMTDRGTDMALDATQRVHDLMVFESEEANKLMGLGMDPDAAFKAVQDFYPNIRAMREKYRVVSTGHPNDPNVNKASPITPNYLGYRGEAGEAQSKNLQTRAATLTNTVPMTGEKPYQQFPQGVRDEATSREINRIDSDTSKPHEGDIHPFDTYQIPPDLTRLRTDLPNGGRREVMPRLGEYDWMLKKPAAFGAGAATPFLMGSDEAQAAPTGGRIGEPTKDEVMAKRLALARQQSQSADQRATGATGPAPARDDAMSVGGLIAGPLSGVRSSAEGLAGSLGDLSFDTGLGFRLPLTSNFMPGQEDVAKATDWAVNKLPEGASKPIQDWTRYEGKNPVEQAWKWLGGGAVVLMGKIKVIMDIGEAVGKAVTRQFDLPKKHSISSITIKPKERSVTTERTGRLTPVKTVHPDELVRQKAKIIGAPGDRTPAGQTLTGINEQRFDKGIYQGGGRDFARDFPGQDPDDPLAWMSGKQVNEGYGRGIRAAAGEGPVMFAPITMSHQSGDFSGMMARTVIEQMKNAPMTADNLRILEMALRQKTPDQGMPFPTFKELHDDPEFLTEWLSKAGTGRTNLPRLLDTGYWQDRGAPDIVAARLANIAEDQVNSPFGSVGKVMVEADPSGRVVTDPLHPRDDYPTGVPMAKGAEPIGLAHEIPADIMFPDEVAKMRANMAARGSDPSTLTMNNIVDALGKRKVAQEATPEWRDGIMRFTERHGMKMALAAGMLTPAQAYTHFGYTGEGDNAL